MRLSWLKWIDGIVGKALVAVFAPLSQSFRRRPERIESVLVIRPGGIGDAVLLLPALGALKTALRPDRIDVVAEARNADVFCLSEAVTKVYRYDRLRDWPRVLSQPYDLVIDTEQWHRLSAVFAFFTRAAVRVGFATNERARLFTHCVPYAQADYEADSFLKLVAALTGHTTVFNPATPFVRVQPRSGRDRSRPTAVIFPGASVPERRWGGERFGQLAARLVRSRVQVVVVGGNGDLEQGLKISSTGDPHVTNLVGALSIKEVCEVLAGADVMVTADSGLMHLAVAVGTPTVSLFGAGIRPKWAPRGAMHRVLSAELPCSPCTEFGYTPSCPIEVECLRMISVDEVLAATLDVIMCKSPARIPMAVNQ
jgi:ADP-heptose:LPS heptosyltransferase